VLSMSCLDILLSNTGVLGGDSERNGGENRDEYDCDGGRFVHEVAPAIEQVCQVKNEARQVCCDLLSGNGEISALLQPRDCPVISRKREQALKCRDKWINAGIERWIWKHSSKRFTVAGVRRMSRK